MTINTFIIDYRDIICTIFKRPFILSIIILRNKWTNIKKPQYWMLPCRCFFFSLGCCLIYVYLTSTFISIYITFSHWKLILVNSTSWHVFSLHMSYHTEFINIVSQYDMIDRKTQGTTSNLKTYILVVRMIY